MGQKQTTKRKNQVRTKAKKQDKNMFSISEIIREKEALESKGKSLQVEKQEFLDHWFKSLQEETRTTLLRRAEGDLKKETTDYYDELSNFVEGWPVELITALHPCSALDFDTFWCEVELGEGRRRKTLHIVVRLNGDPVRPHVSYASEPGSTVTAELRSRIHEVWRHDHLQYPLGEYASRRYWTEDFLQKRENRLSSFIKENLLSALKQTNRQIIEEGLIYDLLTDEEYESFITRRQRDIAQQVGERMGRYRKPRRGISDLSGLSDHYKELLPQWRRAMRDAKADQKHPIHRTSWRKRILDGYGFPDDLIEWLSPHYGERERNLASHENSAFLKGRRKSSKGADDQQYELRATRDLALEHAARLCDASPYYYSVSHLKGLLSSKRTASSKRKK